MEIKRFGDPKGKKIMLLHGNLMCWRQFEDVIPLLEKEFDVYAVSFDGFDGTGETTYTTAQEQADKLRKVYPKLTVRCFSDFGHGDILNHPALLAEKLKNEII